MSSQFGVSMSQQSTLSANMSPPVSEDVLSLEEAMNCPAGKISFDLVPMVLFNDSVATQRCRKHSEGPHRHYLLSLLNKMKAPKPLKDRARILIRSWMTEDRRLSSASQKPEAVDVQNNNTVEN